MKIEGNVSFCLTVKTTLKETWPFPSEIKLVFKLPLVTGKNDYVIDLRAVFDFIPFDYYSGNLGARYIRLENPAHPVRYQGVVCSLKESFGFIERGDVVREIFFHFSEAKGIADSLELGDDVEFTIQTRNVNSLYKLISERNSSCHIQDSF